MYAARHSANVPAGFVWPSPMPRSECTVHMLPSAIRIAISVAQDKLRPAWEVSGSGAARPDRAECIRLARIAHSFRKPERKAYALAWVKWCCRPEGEAPGMLAHKIAPEDARAIRQRFADEGIFDPRDFHGVPF